MLICSNVKTFWTPVRKMFKKMSDSTLISKYTSKTTAGFYMSVCYLVPFLFIRDKKNKIKGKYSLKISKVTEKMSRMKIPKIIRKPLFKTFCRYYRVRLDEIKQSLESFSTLSEFFTRKIVPRKIGLNHQQILAPADSKMNVPLLKELLTHSQNYQQISGQQYSGQQARFSSQDISALKKVIMYLAPGDYHRFHSPVNIQVIRKKQIGGVLLRVDENTLMKYKNIYQKNRRVCLHGIWNQGYFGMIMVGAMNVGRICIHENQNFEKGQQMGFFDLGSTIVMLYQAKDISQWYIKEGSPVRYGMPLCKVAD